MARLLSKLRVPLLVSFTLLSSSCLAAGVGAIVAKNAAADAIARNIEKNAVAGSAKVTFDNVKFTVTKLKGSPTDSLTVRGLVKWHPAEGTTSQSNARFFPLGGEFACALLNKDGQLVTSLQGILRAWDGGAEVGALPPDRFIQFELGGRLAKNMLAASTSARMSDVLVGTVR